MRARHDLPATALVLALALGCARQEPGQATNSRSPPTTPAGAIATPSLKAAEEWKRPPEIQENISVERCSEERESLSISHITGIPYTSAGANGSVGSGLCPEKTKKLGRDSLDACVLASQGPARAWWRECASA